MSTQELRSDLDAVGKMMLGFLESAHASHQEATCHTTVTDQQILAFRGGMIEVEEDPPIQQDVDALMESFRSLFKRAQELGQPVQMVEYRFRRGAQGWTYELALETLAAHEALEQERAPLDQDIVKSMLTVAGSKWTSITFEKRLSAPARLLVLSGRERRELPVAAELETLLKRTFELYSKHGRELRWPLWRIKGNLDEHEVVTEMFYG